MTSEHDGGAHDPATSEQVMTAGGPTIGTEDARRRSWIGELLEFERDGDTFTAPQRPTAGQRLFGGLVAAQALGAATATVADGKQPQSLHAYFVRPGKPGSDVVLEVERTRDGGSFDTRRVTASQEGSVILQMLASFHVAEPGADDHPPGPAAIGPDDAPDADVPFSEIAELFELRLSYEGPFTGPPYWIRSRAPVEDDPIVRACALTFMSDIGLMIAARPPGTPLTFSTGTAAASLDHTIWFHRPFDPQRWHTYQTRRLNNNDARGLALGSYYDADGVLVATTAQEALWRV